MCTIYCQLVEVSLSVVFALFITEFCLSVLCCLAPPPTLPYRANRVLSLVFALALLIACGVGELQCCLRKFSLQRNLLFTNRSLQTIAVKGARMRALA